MNYVKILIGGNEYDTGSYVARLPENVDDWEVIKMMIDAYLEDKMREPRLDTGE
jgi:hypothetical protein